MDDHAEGEGSHFDKTAIESKPRVRHGQAKHGSTRTPATWHEREVRHLGRTGDDIDRSKMLDNRVLVFAERTR